MVRTQPQEIITRLEADNSRLAKEAVLQSAMEEGLDEFFEGVRMALDPLVTFGVKQVPEKDEVIFVVIVFVCIVMVFDV